MKTSFWTRLLDVISPRCCVVCGRRLSVNERAICACCHMHLPLTHYERQPLDNPMARLFWGQFPVERVAALFFFKPRTRMARIIYEMKYEGRPEIGETMGEIAAGLFAAAGFFEGIDAIVPMPTSRRRRWRRGYNQCMEIARGVSNVTGLPVCGKVVRRSTFSKSQTKQHGWDRQTNVDGAFTLHKTDGMAGRHLLLVDDVVTTGATITACARELAKLPGVRISIMALGRTKQ